ncbi:MAG: DNA primase [Lentimicrobiaceae bacterium]|nr:DNA primase [Lentimicrobiaceae bacterium]
MIPQETIQRIIDTAQISEVVSDFVSLRRSGSNLIGLCPFHDEKTPSFFVSPSKGIFKCFGCGKAGNPISFVMEHEKYTYPEALRYLAKKYNIPIEETVETEQQVAERTEKESIYLVTEFALKFFKKQLWETDEGKSVGLSYFRERGFNDSVIEKFELGYSPNAWDALTKEALKNGYSKEVLEKSGLSTSRNEKLFDRFRGRVIFPIYNQSGKVIGFGGRTLSSDKNQAKYLNSPETLIYNKSNTLYGLNIAKHAIVANDMCYLVEGYTDVLSMYQAGIQNIVASSGTSLTTDQIKLIKRYSQNVTVMYDGDNAGIKASFRGIDMILEQGMNVKVLLFPDGEDPDSFAKNKRDEEIKEYIKSNIQDFIAFKMDLLMTDVDANDPIKKVSLLKEFINSIAVIPDRLTRLAYVQLVAEKMQIDDGVVMSEVNKALNKKFYDASKQRQTYEEYSLEIPVAKQSQAVKLDVHDSTFLEKEIIRLLLTYGNEEIDINNAIDDEDKTVKVRVADYIIGDIKNDEVEFTNSSYNQIINICSDLISKNQDFDSRALTHNVNPDISQTVIDIVANKYTFSPNWEKKKIYLATESDVLDKLVPKTLLSYKAKRINQVVQELLKQMQNEEDEEQKNKYVKKYLDVKKC